MSEGFHFKYWVGDLYLSLKLRKAIVGNKLRLFLEPNLRYSPTAYENGRVSYTDKAYPCFGFRTGWNFEKEGQFYTER